MSHKTYVTFGQIHRHVINGTVFDKDCVAVITTNNPKEGREKAFELFGKQFCFEYPEQYKSEINMQYFPRGEIEVSELLV